MSDQQWSLVIAALLTTFVLTAVTIPYGRYAGLLDLPGERRTHDEAIPRGGGVAMLVSLIVASLAGRYYNWIEIPLFLIWISPLSMVAVVGWWDDHAPLPVKFRMCVQIFAVVTMLAGFYPIYPFSGPFALLLLVSALWLLNLFNFMDGSHGLAAGQGIFVGAILAWLLSASGQSGAALCALLLVAVCLGFLPWNFPRPKVFMGDVASGPLGLAFAILAIWAWLSNSIPVAVLVLTLSTFIMDATLTLLNRMYRGQRWYTAHAEHAYQRMIAMDCGHTETFLLYQSVNLFIVLPGVVWTQYSEGSQWTITGSILLAQALAWLWVYRRSVKKQKQQ